MVWMPAHLQFENGGESVALIPTRYPGSEAAGGRPDRAGAQDRRGKNWRRTRTAGSASASSPPTPTSAAPGGPHDLAHRQRARSRRIPAPIMADQLPPQDRLQPALLDRLTDDEPDKKQEPREAARACRSGACAQSVLRDLAWLFNATRLEPDMDLATVPYVRRSVINFGLPALSGQDGLLARSDGSRARHPQAILDFEPRILPGTLHDADAARGRRARSSQRHRRRDLTASSGRSRCRSSCWSAPRSISKPARCRSPISRRRGWREWIPACSSTTTSSCSTCARWAPSSPQQFPKIAARLGMSGLEVADPYVERLLEGVGVPGRARAAEARRRVSALHAGAARDRLSALPRADAVDAGRAAAPRQERSRPGRRHPDGAARNDAAFDRRSRPR